MTGAALLPMILDAIAVAAGLGLFALYLVGAHRGTRSRNLEYGVMPAILPALVPGLVDRVTGWPGWPGSLYLTIFIVLAVAFCSAILRAAGRGGTGS